MLRITHKDVKPLTRAQAIEMLGKFKTLNTKLFLLKAFLTLLIVLQVLASGDPSQAQDKLLCSASMKKER